MTIKKNMTTTGSLMAIVYVLIGTSHSFVAWGKGGEGVGGGGIEEFERAVQNAPVPGISIGVLSPDLALDSLKVIESIQNDAEGAIQLIKVFSFMNIRFKDQKGMELKWELLADLMKTITIVVDLENEFFENPNEQPSKQGKTDKKKHKTEAQQKFYSVRPKTFLNDPKREILYVAAKKYLAEKQKYTHLSVVLTVLHEFVVILGFQDEEPNENLSSFGYSLTRSVALAIPQLLQSKFVIDQLTGIRDTILNARNLQRNQEGQGNRDLRDAYTKGLILAHFYKSTFRGNPRDVVDFIERDIISLCLNKM